MNCEINYKEELETGNIVKEHEDAYKTFFIVKETPVRGVKVNYNNEAIQKYRNQYAGFHAILSNGIKDTVEALRVYRDKDVVEKCFDDLKNQLDMKRLIMHNSLTMDGRLFVQFIALIYLSALRREMRKTGLIDKYSVHELLGEMETLTKICYSGKYGNEVYLHANGCDNSPVKPHMKDNMKSIGRSTTLPEDIADIKKSEIILMELAENIGMTAREHGKKGRTIQITLKYSNFKVITRQTYKK